MLARNRFPDDNNFTVPANGRIGRAVTGNFIFLKSSTGDVTVNIDGNKVTLSVGDVIDTVEPFTGFDVENDTGSDITGVMVIGFGDYRRSTISGAVELTSPGTITDGADVSCPNGATTLVLAANANRSRAHISTITGGLGISANLRVGSSAVDVTHGTPLYSGLIVERVTKDAIYVFNNTGAPVVVTVSEDE